MNTLTYVLAACIVVMLGVCLVLLAPLTQIEKRRLAARAAWMALSKAMEQTQLALQIYADTKSPSAAAAIMKQYDFVIRTAISRHGIGMNAGTTKDGWISHTVFAELLTAQLLAWKIRIETGHPWYDQPNS